MKERTLISSNAQEWSEYLKSQIDLWPEWKKTTSSYSYIPIFGNRKKEDRSDKQLVILHGL